MPSMPSLIKHLQKSYPDFKFEAGERFSWQPESRQITYNQTVFDGTLLLHELGHALLGHASYRRDVELLGLERAAWSEAKRLGKQINLPISPTQIDNHLDTYRDWLHARSSCPSCQSSGVQISELQYSCPTCSTVWRVNEARSCGLRRTVVK